MKRGTFKTSTNLYRFRDSAIIVRTYVRNNNKMIFTKAITIQQTITPEAEVKKSVVYNDPEAETINHYFNLFKQEVKQLAETSTPETIADDIERLVEAPVFENFFNNHRRRKRHEKETGNRKRGTFIVSAHLVHFSNNTIVVRTYVRNNNKMIFTKYVTIQDTITPETINYYFNLFKNEVKSLAETSTPETIADDIERLVEAPVFENFFINHRRRKIKRVIETDVRIVRDFDPYAFNDDFKGKAHVLHTNYRNKFGEPLCIKENYKRAVKNGSYSGSESRYYHRIKPYLDDIESWQQIQDDDELIQRMEIYNNDRLINFALDDEPTEEKEYAPYISRDQWEVMMDNYIQKLKIKWQQEKQQTAEK